ncbi:MULTISPECIES: DeoR/GlpR family DNA-binding transcription regulator [unclassified Paenibacillus]|uniref:DeoR/GlpR family DNA-binding transcription regulator n=1 Tax=unclassified Paenibacillus TaxID=185978 RepID=UPI0010432863|nr:MULTISPECIES: DeoR/GlpR family DNA-binding transcription regulator [unclassified Paenibacillus]NIK68745.1 DeoR/GlpR family transcriptional regulator of sugar metabolism [Paenibacillus sp. BK720]TCM98972.1 DeoR family transcriptional regulator [Paenibacillus sp. BK033]
MNAIRRHELIMEALLASREVTVQELSERLDVTGKTIREDLARLEEKGLLLRIHGGAVLAQTGQLGILSQQEPLARHASEKTEIAELALSFIETGDIIALDGGSTTLEIAKKLRNQPLTVVTNDVHIIAELSRKDEIQLVVPGGYRVRNMLAGAEAEAYIRKLNIKKAFLSATGVHAEFGFTIYTGDLTAFKRALLDTAQSSYVVVDHHKFGQGALFTFAGFHEIRTIITDSGISTETAEQYRQAGANLTIYERMN